MNKKITTMISLLLAVILLVFSGVTISAEDTEIPEEEPEIVYTFEVGEDHGDGTIIDNGEYVCGCCHKHRHADNFGGKFACFFCKIGMFFKKIFGIKEKDVVHCYKVTTTPATCQCAGKTILRCAVCDHSKEFEHEQLEHIIIQVAAQAPTCTEDGWEAYEYCPNCDYTTQVIIPALNHRKARVGEYIPATCTTNGREGGIYCYDCNTWLEEAQEIPALGHSEINHQAKDPTCTAIGWDAYVTCSRCDYTTYAEKSALGHDYNTEFTIDIEPTCAETGSKSKHCSRCSEKTEVTAINALGHDFGEWEVVTEPTCTADGQEKRECSRCDAVEYQTINKLGHDFATTFTTDVEPTCTTAGSKSKHCSRCSEKTEVTAIDALGHDFGEWEVVTEPTCTADGQEKRECSRCDTVEYQTINKLGHDFATTFTTDVEPTCTTAGSKSRHCSRCSETTDVTIIPANGHTGGTATCIDLAVCSVCHVAYGTTNPNNHVGGTYLANAKESTCTTQGYTGDTCCSGCNSILSAGTVLALAEHDYSTEYTIIPATCGADGSKYRKCKNCDAITDEEIIPQLVDAHDFIDGAQVSNLVTTKTGINTVTADYTCANCGTALTNAKIPAVASVDGYNTVYHTLEAANAAANNANIYLLCDYTLQEDMTIASGNTLIIPCMDGDVGYTTQSDTNNVYDKFSPNNTGTTYRKALYRIFTIPENKTITVNGTMLINAETSIAIAAAPDYGVSGNYSDVNLGGIITVNNGGIFDCAGYVTDNGGLVNLFNGARMFETYGVKDWRGGSAGYAMNSKGIWPIDEFEMNCMRATLNMEYGAMLSGSVKMFANSRFYYCHFNQIYKDSDAMCYLKEGATCTRTVDSSNRTHYKFYGNVDFGSSSITLEGQTLKSSSFKCKFAGNSQVEFYNGTIGANFGFVFMPGFKMIVGEGATMNFTGTNPYIFAHGEAFTLNGTLYEDYYYYDDQFTGPGHMPAGRGDAKLYVLDGGVININGSDSFNPTGVYGRIYLDSASSINRIYGYDDVAKTTIPKGAVYKRLGFIPTVDVNEFPVPYYPIILSDEEVIAVKAELGLN